MKRWDSVEFDDPSRLQSFVALPKSRAKAAWKKARNLMKLGVLRKDSNGAADGLGSPLGNSPRGEQIRRSKSPPPRPVPPNGIGDRVVRDLNDRDFIGWNRPSHTDTGPLMGSPLSPVEDLLAADRRHR